MRKLNCPISKQSRLRPYKCAIKCEKIHISYQDLNDRIEVLKAIIEKHITKDIIALKGKADLFVICFYFAALRARKSVVLISENEPPSSFDERCKLLDAHVCESLESFENIAVKRRKKVSKIPSEHIASYIFTSGSSAQPKICALTFKNHMKSAKGLSHLTQISPRSMYLLSLPLSHISGLSILYRVFYHGACCVIPSAKGDFIESIKSYKISHLSLVSTQLIRLLKECESFRFSHLKMILLGGGFFDPSSLKKGLHYGLPLYLSYGLTEMSSTVTCKKLSLFSSFTLGKVLPYRRFFLSNEQEIILSGETLFKGYYDIRLKKIIPVGKLYYSKDSARLSNELELELLGRTDRRIISGGVKIYPEELEMHILAHPSISRCYVFFQKTFDDLFHPIALIESKDPINFLCLQNFLNSRLPSYKIPKHYFLWPSTLTHFHKLTKPLKEFLENYALAQLKKDFSKL